MKKFLAVVLFSCTSWWLPAQVFHFNNTSTTLVKTTDQSPAHWYIEIHSDINVDTTLRWICHFNNIPSAWNITFDDGDNNYPTVNDLDSNDFVMLANLSFPQKLIIGAMLNNTPGNGSVCFDVFDPDNRSQMTTICYHFIISQGTASLQENLPANEFNWINNELQYVGEGAVEYLVYDGAGKLVKKELKNTLKINDLPNNQLLYIEVKVENKSYIIKLFN